MVGTALGGEIATYSEFDRKNYFYPDIPKAYQISQYQFPFVRGGVLADVAITRVHLEEDTARSLNDQGNMSIVDFNRAGVPLMELVTEPVIHDAETAGRFARELQLLLRTLGVSDANMERGEMRVEANISVSPDDTLRTKVEVKNLNSFRSVEAAIAYEIDRQIHIYEEGGEVAQETRGWDEQKNVTFSQRTKETAPDYRYFPDPDIPKFQLAEIDEFDNSRISEIMPKLPAELRLFWDNLGVKRDSVELLLANSSMNDFALATVESLGKRSDAAQLAINYLTSDIFGILQREPERTLKEDNSAHFAALVLLAADGEITSRVAKDLLSEVVFEGADARELAETRGLLQKNSAEELDVLVGGIIAEHQAVVAEFKAGKDASLQFLIGQAMKATKGTANPKILTELFTAKIRNG